VGEAPERLPSGDDYWSLDPAARERKYEEECESVLSDIYSNLQKVPACPTADSSLSACSKSDSLLLCQALHP
jgi:hypothetical protein